VAILAAAAGCTKAAESNGKGDTSTASATGTTTAGGTSTTSTQTSAGGSAPGTLALSTIESLPSVLDPVLALDPNDSSTEAKEAAAFDKLAIDAALTTTAEEGASLGKSVATLNAAFEAATNPSKAMCDTVNSAMKFVFEAGSPDFMSCIIKGSGLSADETLYAGTEKLYKFSITMEGQTMRYLVKLKVNRSAGVVDRFSFHSCGEDGGDWKQSQWFEQKIAGGKMTIDSKMSGPEGSLSALALSAQLDSEGKLRGLKTMKYRDTHVEQNRYKSAEVTQSPANILYKGYESASGGGIQVYSFYELLDKNVEGEPYAITKLAIGDGAALVKQGDSLLTQGWNGDTLSINSDEKRLAKVEGMEGELIPALTEGNEPYAGDEAFDCVEAGAVEMELDVSMVQACEARFEIDQEGENFCSGLSY
jgi:hypothetical protein